jgi:hypothetical protein
MLSGGRDDASLTPAQRALLERARLRVAERPSALAIPTTQVVAPLPAQLMPHAEELRTKNPGLFADGWEMVVVDLRQVSALQPVVHLDHAVPRTEGTDGADLVTIAALTVPTVHDAPLRASFDEARNTWVIASSNRNLRLIGRFTAPVAGAPLYPGASNPPGFGFVVTVVPSYLQVAEFRGRHVLRDGYHRALGLLTRGVNLAPALVRQISAVEDLTVPGALPQEAYLGSKPPMLPDYLDDDVATEVWLPESQKMVLIQGMELDFLI